MKSTEREKLIQQYADGPARLRAALQGRKSRRGRAVGEGLEDGSGTPDRRRTRGRVRDPTHEEEAVVMLVRSVAVQIAKRDLASSGP